MRSNPSTTYFGKAIASVLEQNKLDTDETKNQSETDNISIEASNKITNFLMNPVMANLTTNSRIDWEDGKYFLNEKRDL